MRDLATRPRGGWQVGGLRRAVSADVLAGADPEVTDCYSVRRQPDGVFQVRHYPSDHARACCAITVRRRAGEAEGDALHRAYLLCEQQHQVRALESGQEAK